MGKTGRWIRNLLTGKKEKERERGKEKEKERENDQDTSANDNPPTTPISIPQQPTTPKEKRRWSFRRSSATAPPKHDSTPTDHIDDYHHPASANDDPKKPQPALSPLSTAAPMQTAAAGHEAAAATKIQAVFRAYLARKALNALRGLVKLQALVRGHLVRKQATATLRCMQALVTAQARARAHRLHMVEDNKYVDFHHRKSTQLIRNSNQDYGAEENIKIVEMDLGDYKPMSRARNSYSNHSQPERFEQRTPSRQEQHQISDISPRTVEDYCLGTAESSPQCYSSISKPNTERLPFSYPRSEYAESLYSDYPFYPNYMANTQSSRAKVRSHSAPKQRPVENIERQPSRRRPSIEGRNLPRAVRMQRSSSHVAAAAQNYQYPWSVKLDRSSVSLKESECGSSSTVLTNTNYCRSLVGFEVQGARY